MKINDKRCMESDQTARKNHKARTRLVIETDEWLIKCYARSGNFKKCEEMAAQMMVKAEANPQDFGRWKSVIVQTVKTPK